MDNSQRPNNIAESIPGKYACERRHTVSFLDLPRELREMVYSHIPNNSGAFTYDTRIKRRDPHSPSLDVGGSQANNSFDDVYGNPGVAFGTGDHPFAILSTCRTIHSEALPILYAKTPLGLWRSMYDCRGQKQYPAYVAKVFSSLPVHATQHIRILQLQGELWLRSMETLLATAIEKLPSLKVLEIGLDPYLDAHKRKHWFDHRAMLRQSWPAVATLHLIAQRLSVIDITISPPKDTVHINALDDNTGLIISGLPYQRFLWQYLQLSVLCYEISIYGAILHDDAKRGMEVFMDQLVQRRDLLELRQVKTLAEKCIAGTSDFKIQNEKEWLKEITGRVIEVDEEKRRVGVMSERNAEVKWCRMTYTSEPRGYVVSRCDVDGEELATTMALPENRGLLEAIDQRLSDM
ncbi:unnamed protein product [Aureobasidium uvarum]|uniref:F-box domain-containing protein n=1 Tax=Aureobasidium uvarum TaxID=2773716 RepID=A0A9N8KCC6_9PEZI|nr:unnamed protein product [Aureobasidium uvarum]